MVCHVRTGRPFISLRGCPLPPMVLVAVFVPANRSCVRSAVKHNIVYVCGLCRQQRARSMTVADISEPVAALGDRPPPPPRADAVCVALGLLLFCVLSAVLLAASCCLLVPCSTRGRFCGELVLLNHLCLSRQQ